MSFASVSTYRKIQVTTASPVQLVIQLFEGLVRFTEQGIQAIERRDLEQAHTALVRAQAIVTQLRGSLNRDVGALGDPMDALYDYFFRQLVLANVQKDASPAREILGYVRELLAVWREVARHHGTDPDPARAAVDVRS